MKKPINYTDEPIEFEIINDFLPPPEQLVMKEETIKVTMSLNKTSVNFFKEWAKKQHTPYQAMIRQVIDGYVKHYQK